MKGRRVVKEIEIKNYRGLKQIKFFPKSINVVVGPNDTGKSSILEAIGLLLSSRNDFRDILFENDILFGEIEIYFEDLIDYLLSFKEYLPRYLIRTGAQSGLIQGIVGRTHYALVIEYGKLPKQPKNQLMLHLKEKIREIAKWTAEIPEITFQPKSKVSYTKDAEKLQHKIFDRFMRQPKLFLTLYKNGEMQSFYVHFDLKEKWMGYVISDGVERIYSRQRSRRIPLILNFSKLAFASKIEGLHDLVVRKGKIPTTIHKLAKRISYITDIRKAEEGRIYVFSSIQQDPLPLSLMGDGFISLLKINFLLSLAEKGVIILEEPEVSLHPAFLDIVAEEIIDNSVTTQFFISTHSLDLLYSLLKKAEEKGKLEEVNVIRLHRKKDAILSESLDGKEAKSKMDEIGLDLRRT